MTADFLARRDAALATARREDVSPRDERVWVNLPQLTKLQHVANGLSFLPRQPVQSLLSGRHASRVRGRGLQFEEIRDYHAGDDVRAIDWKVTARLRSPHTRVFTEERDRPVLLLVDQRIGMFFGSRVWMKSVTAAETAAIAAWRVLDAGDRVGAIVFDDDSKELIAPKRSRLCVAQILKTIVKFNQRLHADSPARTNAGRLDEALDDARRLATHDYLVIVVSDFFGYSETTLKHLRAIRSHNDLIVALVHDPSASQMPSSKDLVVTDGELQAELAVGQERVRRRLEDTAKGRIAEIMELQRTLQAPVLPISTAEEVSRQLHRLLGRARQAGGAGAVGNDTGRGPNG